MVPAVAFVGYHDSGKTTFATKVVKILKEKGYRVGVLKSTKHRGVIEDSPGTDSFRYAEAGADGVGIVEPERLILFKGLEERNPEYLAFSLFSDCDLVVCEGFKNSELPKFEVVRREFKEKMLGKKLKNLIGVVSDFPVEGVKNFPIEHPEAVAEFVEKEFIEKRGRAALFVNGKRVPMNRFVQESLAGVLKGFLSALKGIDPEIEKIEVKVVLEKK